MFRARFKREAEAVASLNNPAIVAVYDTGSLTPRRMVGSLILRKRAPLFLISHGVRVILCVPFCPVAATCRSVMLWVIIPAAGCRLQYSHSMGIIHRDKPANIMVLDRTSEDIAKGQPGQIKVMDFGISRAIEEAGEALTKANVVM